MPLVWSPTPPLKLRTSSGSSQRNDSHQVKALLQFQREKKEQEDEKKEDVERKSFSVQGGTASNKKKTPKKKKKPEKEFVVNPVRRAVKLDGKVPFFTAFGNGNRNPVRAEDYLLSWNIIPAMPPNAPKSQQVCDGVQRVVDKLMPRLKLSAAEHRRREQRRRRQRNRRRRGGSMDDSDDEDDDVYGNDDEEEDDEDGFFVELTPIDDLNLDSRIQTLKDEFNKKFHSTSQGRLSKSASFSLRDVGWM